MWCILTIDCRLRGSCGRKAGVTLPLCYLCKWKAFQELVAQLVEQRTFNAWVSGSIPDELTTPQAANPSKNLIAVNEIAAAVCRKQTRCGNLYLSMPFYSGSARSRAAASSGVMSR